MDIFEAYEMSEEAVENGVWAELVVKGEQIGRVRVRSSDPDINPDYRSGLSVSALATIAMDKSANGADLSAQKDDLAIALLVDTVLTDWELYKMNGEGKEVKIKFTKGKAKQLLKKLPKLRAAVERASANWTSYRRTAVDETVKI
jgi:hypothetical protein